jgi:hypothetical protein
VETGPAYFSSVWADLRRFVQAALNRRPRDPDPLHRSRRPVQAARPSHSSWRRTASAATPRPIPETSDRMPIISGWSTPWSTLDYVEKVRSQFFSLRQQPPAVFSGDTHWLEPSKRHCSLDRPRRRATGIGGTSFETCCFSREGEEPGSNLLHVALSSPGDPDGSGSLKLARRSEIPGQTGRSLS